MQKYSKYHFILLFLCIPNILLSTRHSRLKKIERLEQQKKVVISGDEKLSRILSKHSKHMTFEEAVLAKDYYLKERNTEMAITCGKRALAVGVNKETSKDFKYEETKKQIRYELCYLLIEKKDFKEAEEYAKEYIKHYPGAEDAIRAEYIAIQANFLSQSTSDRDQEKTRITIKRAQEFLEKHTSDNEFSSSIRDMLLQSYLVLIRSEMNIIESHLNAFNATGTVAVLDAAIKRLAHVKEKYVPHALVTKKRILEMEKQLLLAAKKKEESEKIDKEIAALDSTSRKESSWVSSVKRAFVEDVADYFAS